MSRKSPVSRRSFLTGAGALAAASLPGLQHLASAAPVGAHLTADESLRRLLEGNQRFVSGKSMHPRSTPNDFRALAAGENPTVAVLSCADSRVPPELVFDQGLGDVFSVRIAGNYVMGAGAPVLGSLEYAVSQLNVPLIVVLGHSQCSAIKTAIEHFHDESMPGELSSLVAPLKPIIREAHGAGDMLIADSIRLNVRRSVYYLRTCGPILSQQYKTGKLKIVGGIYDLGTGVVNITA